MNVAKKRLAIIATHPIQYQAPIWRVLAQMPDLDVRVYYGSDFSVQGYKDPGFGLDVKWDVPLLTGYDYTFLSMSDGKVSVDGMFSLHASNLRKHLRQYQPDCALVTAYLPAFWLEVIGILRYMRIPILFRAEATDVAISRQRFKRAVRSWTLRLLYRQMACCLAIGHNARGHYLAHGVPTSRIGWSPYCIDTDLFEQQRDQYLPQRVDIRRELGLCEDQFVVIYSGKLTPKKDPFSIVRALELMPEQPRERIGLIVVGDGELRQSFEAASHKAISRRAIFVGFINQSQIGKYYAAADCLILPSAWGETWGLVVNEALQFGLPAIVSDRVGCYPDLIVEDETGYVFPVGDAQQLCMCMLKAMNLVSTNRDAVSQRCRSRVAAYSVQAAAEGIRAAVFSL